MYFLIDYENVGKSGLTGTQYLEKADTVILFYSNACLNIQQGYATDLMQKAGDFSTVKLKKQRKNALDFYIAVKVGELVKISPRKQIAIISRDNGFMAVFDYIEAYTESRGCLRVKETIEDGITSLDPNSERANQIKERRETKKLETEFFRYRQRKAIYQKLSEIGDVGQDEANIIVQILETEESPQARYRKTLHYFGIKRGQLIYRAIKGLQ